MTDATVQTVRRELEAWAAEWKHHERLARAAWPILLRTGERPSRIVARWAVEMRDAHGREVARMNAERGACPVCGSGEHGTTRRNPYRVAERLTSLGESDPGYREACEAANALVRAEPEVGLIEHPGANRWGAGDDWRANDPTYSRCKGPAGAGCAGLAPQLTSEEHPATVRAMLVLAGGFEGVASWLEGFSRELDEAAVPVKGTRAEVVKGRKVPLGTRGLVVTLAQEGTRAGLAVDGAPASAPLVWTAITNLATIDLAGEVQRRKDAARAEREERERREAGAAVARTEAEHVGVVVGTRKMVGDVAMSVFWLGERAGKPRAGLRPVGADRRADATWMDVADVAKLQDAPRRSRAAR